MIAMHHWRHLPLALGLWLGVSVSPSHAGYAEKNCVSDAQAPLAMAALAKQLWPFGNGNEPIPGWMSITERQKVLAAARSFAGSDYDPAIHDTIVRLHLLRLPGGNYRLLPSTDGLTCGLHDAMLVPPERAAAAFRAAGVSPSKQDGVPDDSANSDWGDDGYVEEEQEGDDAGGGATSGDKEGAGSGSDFGAALSSLNAGRSMICRFSAEDANRPGARGTMRMMAGDSYSGDIAKEHRFAWDGSRALSIDGNASTLVYEDGEVVAAYLLGDTPLPPSRLPPTFSEKDQQGWQKLMDIAGAMMNADAAQTGYKDRVIVLDFANRTGTVATWQNRRLSEAQAVECM